MPSLNISLQSTSTCINGGMDARSLKARQPVTMKVKGGAGRHLRVCTERGGGGGGGGGDDASDGGRRWRGGDE